MRCVHFLHIGKTGGTAIRLALTPYVTFLTDLEIVLHPHETTLAQIPDGENAIFALRDPVDRFVSGFNSRRRRGPPHNVEWNAAETAAFGRFATPNNLAAALSATDSRLRAEAVSAMQGIRHVNTRIADWLSSVDYVRQRRRDILWVGFASRLSQDFARLLQILGLPADARLPDDPRMAHRRHDTDPIWLSELATDNIKNWYAGDYAFLEYFFAPSAEHSGHLP